MSSCTWTAIPNYHFEKHGGLLILLNCNYSVQTLDSGIPLFYRELLEYFQELRSSYEDPLKREFILWNNKKITIENKSVFWKAWRNKNVLFVQDLLNKQGNYLSPQEFSEKYNIKVNFLQYYQITSAIPTHLKSYASAHTDLGDLNSICENFDFQLSYVTLNLKKTFCKQFYKLFVEKINTEPTAIKSWRKHSPEVAENWVHCIQNNYKITRDNKLRQFYFKLLHRILVTNKELKCYGITDCVKCVMCGDNDSIEHTFLESQSFLKLCDESLQCGLITFQKLMSVLPHYSFFFIYQPHPPASLINKQWICVFFCYMRSSTIMRVKQCKRKSTPLNLYPNLLFSLK